MSAAVDFFFRIEQNPEPDQPSNMFFISQHEWLLAPPDAQWPVETLVEGALIDSWTTDDPGRDVEGARQAQERENWTEAEWRADEEARWEQEMIAMEGC